MPPSGVAFTPQVTTDDPIEPNDGDNREKDRENDRNRDPCGDAVETRQDHHHDAGTATTFAARI